MTREADQSDFCRRTWRTLRYSDTTTIFNLSGDRITGFPETQQFRPVRLSAFSLLPFSSEYAERFGMQPMAVIRLGWQALLAVNYQPPANTSITASLAESKAVAGVVSLEHDKLQPLEEFDIDNCLELGRISLRRLTRYSHEHVADEHARIRATAYGIRVSDLGSRNGTHVAVEYGVNELPTPALTRVELPPLPIALTRPLVGSIG